MCFNRKEDSHLSHCRLLFPQWSWSFLFTYYFRCKNFVAIDTLLWGFHLAGKANSYFLTFHFMQCFRCPNSQTIFPASSSWILGQFALLNSVTIPNRSYKFPFYVWWSEDILSTSNFHRPQLVLILPSCHIYWGEYFLILPSYTASDINHRGCFAAFIFHASDINHRGCFAAIIFHQHSSPVFRPISIGTFPHYLYCPRFAVICNWAFLNLF